MWKNIHQNNTPKEYPKKNDKKINLTLVIVDFYYRFKM